MSELVAPYLAEEDSFQLFHLEPAGFNRRLLLDDVVPRTSFSVSRLAIDAATKSEVEKEYQALEEELKNATSKRQIWAGWKIEDDNDGRESLVVFWDPAARSEKIDAFLGRYEQKDTRSFRSICSESVCKL
jgi:hypothetical protein